MKNDHPLMPTAQQFIEAMTDLRDEKELGKLEKFFKGNDGHTQAMGIKFGDLFKLAEACRDMALDEINALLDSDYYEVRMGAVSIMDFKAKDKKTPPEVKKALFDLYLQRHDRLNNWDFVDRGAPAIIGEYLQDKPRTILYELAQSNDPWERRTAIVATHAFIKKNQLDDTFKIAEILINDAHELINKAVGSWLREAGKRDEKRLLDFLDKYAATMPRITLRYAIEKLDESQKRHYMTQ
ncbi:MAG TPA: DNA alkylation repair protein [Saprospiraceae bacterium]|nr:DNA alkylation repair protein [Saprospiraceae bacterium]